ncbi:MAG: hypothetical protein HC908_02340 [Calothrix sp. SM1_7_51]|nr:hypothetical protein [Calothrix sp. SM1_7_51]
MGTLTDLMVANAAVTSYLAEAGSEGGFGLNTDILDTNIINLAIIITVLLVFGRKVVGNTLKSRRENIETAITSAESRVKEAAARLTEAQQNLAQAQSEAKTILAQADYK